MENASKNKKEIVEYTGESIQFNAKDYNDAIEQWNKHFAQ